MIYKHPSTSKSIKKELLRTLHRKAELEEAPVTKNVIPSDRKKLKLLDNVEASVILRTLASGLCKTIRTLNDNSVKQAVKDTVENILQEQDQEQR
ncbi:hypothetical protein BGZ65_006575, partial [Modicella reniformis]